MILDDDDLCVLSGMKASVQARKLETIIHKPNAGLLGIPLAQKSTIEIYPAGNYPVEASCTVTPPSTWLVLGAVETNADRCGDIRANHSSKCHARKVLVGFNATGLEDMEELNATLVLNGTVNGSGVNKTEIQVSAIVYATPSLEKSNLTMPSQATEGQGVRMEIEGFDDEGLPFAKDRGGFIQVILQKPDGSEVNKSSAFSPPNFVFDFSEVRDLTAPGDYKVWISHVFGHVPVQDVKLPLPTRNYPLTLTIESSKMQMIIAAVLSVLALAALGVGGWYARENPGGAAELLKSFLLNVCMHAPAHARACTDAALGHIQPCDGLPVVMACGL